MTLGECGPVARQMVAAEESATLATDELMTLSDDDNDDQNRLHEDDDQYHDGDNSHIHDHDFNRLTALIENEADADGWASETPHVENGNRTVQNLPPRIPGI